MQLTLLDEFKVPEIRRSSKRNTFLTQRDYEIIEFIIDMKFSSVEEIFEKFFKLTRSETTAKSNLWTKKRLIQLKQANFLTAHRSHTERTTYYSATYKGYYALVNFYPERNICKPAGGFDNRTFKHDRLVLKCRLDLESRFKVSNWVSDRKLKASPELSGGLSSVHVPDGIYTLPNGERVAFEIEIARKEKSRYRDKIKKYVHVMRQVDAAKKKFDRVLFVCTKETVKDLLVNETKIFGSIFEIQTINEFIQTLNGGQNDKAI